MVIPSYQHLIFIFVISCYTTLQIESYLLESTCTQVITPKGSQKTISLTRYSIPTYPSKVFDTLCNVEQYSKWFTTSTKFSDYKSKTLRVKGDSFTERFGVFDSSLITWSVGEIKQNKKLSLYTSSMKNTFAWESLEVKNIHYFIIVYHCHYWLLFIYLLFSLMP